MLPGVPGVPGEWWIDSRGTAIFADGFDAWKHIRKEAGRSDYDTFLT